VRICGRLNRKPTEAMAPGRIEKTSVQAFLCDFLRALRRVSQASTRPLVEQLDETEASSNALQQP